MWDFTAEIIDPDQQPRPAEPWDADELFIVAALVVLFASIVVAVIGGLL